MKIIFTVHTYWPKKNGVQYVNQYLAEGLVKKGHEVIIITSHNDSKETRITEHNGVKIISLYLKTRYSFINFGKKAYKKNIMKELKKCDCVINSCVQSPNNNLLLPLLKKMNCTKVLYMHGMHDFKHVSVRESGIKYAMWHGFMNARWKIFYWYNKKNFCRYDAMIDIHKTSQAVKFMRDLGYPKDIDIIQNAVEDFGVVTCTDKDLQKNPLLKEKYFVYVANYTSLKNQKMAVEAFNEIENKKDFHLVLIGGGTEAGKNEVAKFVEKLNLKDKVLVLYKLDRDITKKYIKNAICGIISSRKEVYPVFIAEVMSCRKPYISTDVGCVREMPGGIIVSDLQEMTNAMQRIINDENLRESLGNIGYEFAIHNYSQSEKINELENLIVKYRGNKNV